MRTVLLVGDFRHLKSVIGGLKSTRFIHCHSVETLRAEWQKGRASVVILSVRELTPSVFELMGEAHERTPGLKWAVFVRQGNVDLAPFGGLQRLFLKGVVCSDWLPRLQRFLDEGRQDHRRADRRACRGGVRIKDSEFSRECTNLRAYGTINNLSSHGAAFHFESDPLFPEGEFLEVAFRDPQGAAKTFHGQIRWKRQRSDGSFEIGLQFLAAAG